MDWQDTLYMWELYSEKLYPLRDEVADIFNTHYIWDEKCNCTEKLYETDDDTVFLLKLSKMLNYICDFVKSHINVLKRRVDIEEDIRTNLEQSFEAWKRGLCPLLMKSVPRYVKPDSMNFWETYDEIAEFLNIEQMSYEATQKAISKWQLSREKLKLSA